MEILIWCLIISHVQVIELVPNIIVVLLLYILLLLSAGNLMKYARFIIPHLYEN